MQSFSIISLQMGSFLKKSTFSIGLWGQDIFLETSTVNSEEIKPFTAVKQHRFSAEWAEGFSIKVQKPSVIKSVYLNAKVTLKQQPHDTTASGPSNRFIPTTAYIQRASKCIQAPFIRQEGVNEADFWLKTFWLWSEPHRWDQMHTTP